MSNPHFMKALVLLFEPACQRKPSSGGHRFNRSSFNDDLIEDMRSVDSRIDESLKMVLQRIADI